MPSNACQVVQSCWNYVPSSIISNAATAALGTVAVSMLPLHGVAVTVLNCSIALGTITGIAAAAIACNANGHGRNPKAELKKTRTALIETGIETFQKISKLPLFSKQIIQGIQTKSPQTNPTLEKTSTYAKWIAQETFYTVKGALKFSDDFGGQRNAIYTGMGIAAVSQTFGSTLYSNIMISSVSAVVAGIGAKFLENPVNVESFPELQNSSPSQEALLATPSHLAPSSELSMLNDPTPSTEPSLPNKTEGAGIESEPEDQSLYLEENGISSNTETEKQTTFQLSNQNDSESGLDFSIAEFPLHSKAEKEEV